MAQEQLHSQLDFLKAVSFDFPDEEPNLRPLVFLNACGASAVDPATSGSFPKFFLAHRFLGVIGTETAIPDKVAATFSESFTRPC